MQFYIFICFIVCIGLKMFHSVPGGIKWHIFSYKISYNIVFLVFNNRILNLISSLQSKNSALSYFFPYYRIKGVFE